MSDPVDVTLERYRRVVLACAVMNFRQVARSVTARFDDQLRPVGLRATQLNLLMAIETSTAVTITDLAEILAMDRTTMTRNLKLLRQRKLVDGKTIALTAKGRRAAAAALPLWEKAQAEILESLGKKRWAALLDELEAVKSSIQPRSGG
ncbi:MAG TPA: MarR family winged helix-turn-helix transcriptional regulator [Methylomirabilota bacterium]|nr:MarR family winged helix-turn-helix transcriptional regulator [Methylomirabilota bacterium]